MNIFQLITALKNGGNPNQAIISLMEQQSGRSPLEDNVISLARQGKFAEIEQIAKNLCASRGVNFEQAFSAFRQRFGL